METPQAFSISRGFSSHSHRDSFGSGTMQPGGAFEASTPAFGRSVPCFIQSRNPGDAANNLVALGKHDLHVWLIWYFFASSSARADGVTESSRMTCPSAVATAVSARTRMSPSRKPPGAVCAAAIIRSRKRIVRSDTPGIEPDDRIGVLHFVPFIRSQTFITSRVEQPHRGPG